MTEEIDPRSLPSRTHAAQLLGMTLAEFDELHARLTKAIQWDGAFDGFDTPNLMQQREDEFTASWQIALLYRAGYRPQKVHDRYMAQGHLDKDSVTIMSVVTTPDS